jgi:hypothetical protein
VVPLGNMSEMLSSNPIVLGQRQGWACGWSGSRDDGVTIVIVVVAVVVVGHCFLFSCFGFFSFWATKKVEMVFFFLEIQLSKWLSLLSSLLSLLDIVFCSLVFVFWSGKKSRNGFFF